MEVSIEISYLDMEISNEDNIFKKISEYLKEKSGINLSSVKYRVKPFTQRNYYYFGGDFNEAEKVNEINEITKMMKNIECEKNSLTTLYAEVAFLMHLLHAVEQTKTTKAKKSMYNLFNKSMKFYSKHFICRSNAVKTHNNLKFRHDMLALVLILLILFTIFIGFVTIIMIYYNHK